MSGIALNPTMRKSVNDSVHLLRFADKVELGREVPRENERSVPVKSASAERGREFGGHK